MMVGRQDYGTVQRDSLGADHLKLVEEKVGYDFGEAGDTHIAQTPW